ncbi:hypothetical protein ACFO3I_12555 [Rheinheimera marina]|uniref:DUF2946 domain-containing protein n=1 Tax=Rheinheimera marina TaxID=1774958 RepID=A0ABV9JNJ6_9GAMM
MHSRLRLFAPWLILALLFSNIATAAMWCYQSGGHHQQRTGQVSAETQSAHQGHMTHQMDANPSVSSSSAGDHQTDCPLCAAGCHSAVVLPLLDFTELDSSADTLVIQENAGALSTFPQGRYRPPIA